MPKENLKDKIDGNELDLSLSNLEIVPVKELMALPKATQLDLSCNLLVTLPDEFCNLSHLVRLDLSKNRLTSLPADFGRLIKLQYLDLFQNELRTLPISICRLEKLKWLDVKDNPIHETLKTVAGDCLNEAQCKACAKNIVSFMKKADEQQQREKQERLRKERESERKRRAEVERQKEQSQIRKKQAKEEEKERRRRIYEEKMKLEREKENMCGDQEQQNGKASMTETGVSRTERGGVGCCGVFLAFIIGIAALIIGLYVYCANDNADKFCQESELLLNAYFAQINSTVHFYLGKTQQFLKS